VTIGLFLAGLALLVYGAWLLAEPLGFLIAGGAVMALAVFWERGAKARA
jgi:hypothetical protein